MVVPNFRTHWGFALILWILLAGGGLFLNPVAYIVGSVFPDADHRNAPVGRIFPLWIWFRHRGFVHSLWFLGMASLPWLLWNGLAAISFAAGFFVHMLLDSCTPSGIKWFGGKTKRRFR